MAKRFALQQTKQVRVGFSTGALSYLANKILRDHQQALSAGKDQVELIWVGDNQIKSINKQYRKKPIPTDVLSFSYLDDPVSQLIGQIFISTQTLRRQARLQGHAYYIEAEVLFVHGLLHLLGYDHENKTDFRKMEAQERKYLGDKSGLITRSKTE